MKDFQEKLIRTGWQAAIPGVYEVGRASGYSIYGASRMWNAYEYEKCDCISEQNVG